MKRFKEPKKLKINKDTYENFRLIFLLFIVPIFFVHESSQIIKYAVISVTVAIAIFEIARNSLSKLNKKALYVFFVLVFLLLNFLIRNDYQRVLNLLEVIPSIIIIALNPQILNVPKRTSFLAIQRSGLVFCLLVSFFHISHVYDLYPNISFYQLGYYQRFAGGQNNVMFYYIYIFYVSALLSESNRYRVYWPSFVLSSIVVFTSHSRQAILALTTYFSIHFSRSILSFSLFIFAAVCVFALSDTAQLVYERVNSDLNNGANYRRILMTIEAVRIILSDPFSLNGVKTLEMPWGKDVFDNSFTDLAVRSSLFGLFSVVSVFLLLLFHNRTAVF